jgi:outer membrane protein
MNVGIINLNRLLDESKRGRALGQRLKTTIEKNQAQLTEAESTLEKARQALAKAPPSMPPDPLFKLQRDLRMAELEVRHLQESGRFDIESQREHARNTVLRELDELVRTLAKEKSVSLVLTVPSREVAFAATEIDLTDELLARYDKAAKP